MMIHSRRFIDGRDKRIALQGKQKIVGVLIRLSSEEIYIEITHNIDRFTRSAKLFQSLVKVLQEAFRRVMLSIYNPTDYVRLFRDLNFNPQSLESVFGCLFYYCCPRRVLAQRPKPEEAS